MKRISKVSGVASGLALTLILSACAEKELILEGERFDVRTPLEASLAVEGQPAPTDPAAAVANTATPIALPAMTANADWTHRGGNVRHVSPHGALSAQPTRVWSAPIGTGNSRKNRISAAPVVAEGRIFTMDAVNTVTATATSGATLWSVQLVSQTGDSSEVSGGGLAYGSGRLFAATAFGEVLAIDPVTGATVWRQRLGAPVTGAPAVDGGIVYVVGRDGGAWGVDVADGRVKWTLTGTPTRSGMIGSAAPAITDRAVILPFGSGEVVAALRKSGVRVWGQAVAGERRGRGYAGFTDITGDPVVLGSTVYVGTPAGRTAALSASGGERIWTANEGALGPVLVAGDSLFLVNDEARLVRLDAATGALIWSVEMPYFTAEKIKRRKEITAHYGPVIAGGRIVVASGDGLLRLFNPVDGSLAGTAEIPGGAASQPALAGGALYVVGANGQLHAFR
ncbi:outer membrane protein assembly factor BamB family protein [Aliigemmobacter aestuarii]|uniref:outer membrane protein assembly factor BamB family protein n=1 Tax=Aliigemmobacter aestuarii TaxID=1445661 RepID=UPI001FE851A4|nr:PQQ-binding-like beta-propeller repeat protein [Gemmobacter aestuarii]